MTTFQLQAAPIEATFSAPTQKFYRPLRNRWRYGRAYGVIAAIAPLVLLGLLLVHLHTLGQQWLSSLRLLFSLHRSRY